jgi:hypothetical protein
MTVWTRKERALYDARLRHREEAWGYAESILRPWVEATRPIGSPELTVAMEKALAFAMREYLSAADALEEAKRKRS